MSFMYLYVNIVNITQTNKINSLRLFFLCLKMSKQASTNVKKLIPNIVGKPCDKYQCHGCEP